MNRDSLKEMARLLDKHLGPRKAESLTVLDVGARDINRRGVGTYRDIMPSAWKYTGSDIVPGPNVDLVQEGPYRIQVPDETFDLVISGQCLQRVERPWLLVPEMARLLKRGGLMILTAPWNWPIRGNRYFTGLNCWRICPEGMRVLLQEAGLTTKSVYRLGNFSWGIGAKRG